MDPTNNQGRVRLAEYSTSTGKIRCRRMTLFPTIVEGKGLAKPLGVTFDEQMGEWIVADSGSDRIVLLPLSRAITDEGNRKGRIVYPSAVSILNQGENAVVLTARDIRIVAHGDSQQLTPSVVITKIQGYARGLAVTRLKYVVTMLYDRADGWTVNLFEGKENGALLSQHRYLTPLA